MTVKREEIAEDTGLGAGAMQHLEATILKVQEQLAFSISEQGGRLESALKDQQHKLNAFMEQHSSAHTFGFQLSTHDADCFDTDAVDFHSEAQALQGSNSPNVTERIIQHWKEAERDGGKSRSQFDFASSSRAQSSKLRRSSPVGTQVSQKNQKSAVRFRSGPTKSSITSVEADLPRYTWCYAWLYVCVNHQYFEWAMGVLIGLNAALIFIEADFSARKPGHEEPEIFTIVASVFFLVFAFEIVLKLFVWRTKFICGSEWRWNIFDTFVVCSAAIEEILKILSQDTTGSNLIVLRALRLIKIMRVVRVVRLIKIFRELRIMALSIFSTIMTLFWSIVCLLMIMSSFAVFFATAASQYQADHGPDKDMVSFFGSMPRVMISLFQATTGGLDWRVLSNVLDRVSTGASLVLYAYISMMVYAILNILTGICVNNANRAAEADLEIVMHEEMSKHNSVVGNLKRIFHEADNDQLGTLTTAQLNEHLRNPKVKGYFRRIDLEPWHLRSFFELICPVDEDSIGIDHFIRGCLRFRSTVKNMDLMVSVHDLEERNTLRMAQIQQGMDDLRQEIHNHLVMPRSRWNGTASSMVAPTVARCAI